MKGTDRFLIAFVIGVVILVVIAFAVTLLRPEPEYQVEDSPEGVAHNYLLALQKEDYERAYSYLSRQLEGYPTSTEDFTEDVQDYSWAFRSGRNSTLTIESVDVADYKADVTVRETQFYGGGIFDSSQSINTFEMFLQMEHGDWKIADSEYYFAYCWTFENGCR
ncbi:MAG: hypothetical protein GTO18_22070 [Anaerolineales bacterium]|nr:hypothetical protein [Anaerolineales bacterium]